MSFAANVRMHLSRLADFSGREEPRVFWPWVIVQGGLATTVSTLTLVGVVTSAVLGGDVVNQLGAVVRTYLIALASVAVVVVTMLAAAVTRRLHDAGRSGVHGVLPLPFLALGLLLFSGFTSRMSGSEGVGVDPSSLFTCALLNNFVYLGTLAVLVLLLVKPSQMHENRYGVPPRPPTRDAL